MKFLIQADFLATSNREGIRDCAWNRALLRGIGRAIVEAVNVMNGIPGMTYHWPEYLRSLSDGAMPQTYLSPLAGKKGFICSNLQVESVLRDRKGALRKPTELLFVPQRYLTRDGTPLLDNFNGLFLLSTKYPNSCTSVLKWLGTSELDDALFVQKLAQLSQGALKSKKAVWHEDLARCINNMGDSRPTEVEMVALIPLRNGTWISGKSLRESPAYYDSDELKLAAPTGTNLRLVDRSAIIDDDRRTLFKMLGVTACTPAVVCNAVLNFHKTTTKPQLNVKVLIEHAVYIFTYHEFIKYPKSVRFLWLADSHASSHRASDLYIDLPGSAFSIRQVLNDDGHTFPFLNSRYLAPSGVPKHLRNDFISWLQQSPLGVCHVPRLATKIKYGVSRDKNNPIYYETSLAEDFRQVINSNPSSTFLHIIIQNWEYYYSRTEYKLSIKENASEVFRQLSNQQVDTSMGKRPLKATFLKASKLLKVAEELEVTDLPWLDIDLVAVDTGISKVSSILEHFDVGVAPRATFFIAMLNSLKSRSSMPEKLVHRLYTRLSKHLASTNPSEEELVK